MTSKGVFPLSSCSGDRCYDGARNSWIGSEVTVTPKPLGPEETPVIGVIKAFDRSITPRFSNRDEDSLDPRERQSLRTIPKERVAIAPTKTQLVVELEKVGHPHGLPASDQALGNGLIVLGSLGMKKDAMAVKIHDIERKKRPSFLI